MLLSQEQSVLIVSATLDCHALCLHMCLLLSHPLGSPLVFGPRGRSSTARVAGEDAMHITSAKSTLCAVGLAKQVERQNEEF